MNNFTSSYSWIPKQFKSIINKIKKKKKKKKIKKHIIFKILKHCVKVLYF